MKHRKNKERIVKAKPSGYEEKKVSRLGKIKLAVGFLLVAVIAGSSFFVWQQIMEPYKKDESGEQQAQESSQNTDKLPVYDDEFNLKIANTSSPLSEEDEPKLTEFNGVKVDERIVPALEKMIKDAKKDGISIKITEGYISPKQQDELFNAEVSRLIEEEGYSQVMAEQTAKQTVAPANQDEMQTGMSVIISDENNSSDFSSTAEYRWLYRYCVNYGFVIRYPEGKKAYTSKEFNPSCIRYVGNHAAMQMRQLQMCLEEYVQYSDK